MIGYYVVASASFEAPLDVGMNDDGSDDFELCDSASDDEDTPLRPTQAAKNLRSLTVCKTTKDAKAFVSLFSPFDYHVGHTSTSVNFKRVVYNCSSHDSCPYQVYVTTTLDAVDVSEAGEHGESPGEDRQGINKRVRDEADAMLAAGAGPKKCLKLLNKKYKDIPNMDKFLPEWVQLKNRKLYFKTSGAHVLGETLAHLQQWAGDKMCTTKESFFGPMSGYDPDRDEKIFQEQPKDYKNGLSVLSCFSHNVDIGNGPELSFGVVGSSRRLLRNEVYAARGQGDELLALSDGTYKIHFDHWTLASVGSCGLVNDRGTIVHRYQPWAYIFVRSETTDAYTALFRTVVSCVQQFFDVQLRVKFGSLDHAQPILLAFKRVWPDIMLLNCWPHLARKALEEAKQLGCEPLYWAALEPNLQYLHVARSEKQFRALSQMMISSWKSDGSPEGASNFADWLQASYLHEDWNRWFVVASDCPGVVPNQNPLESHHKAMKKVAIDSLCALTQYVLNHTLPDAVAFAADLGVQRHFCCGSVPAEMITRALLLKSRVNHHLVHKSGSGGKVVQSVVINAREYIDDGSKLNVLDVNKDRVRVFLKSLSGTVDQTQPLAKIQIQYLSLHQVRVLSAEALSHEMKEPIWSIAEIQQVRSKYRCDCKANMENGWVCSHVVVVMALVDKLDLTLLLRNAPPRPPPGRQPEVPGALRVDVQSNGFFDPNRLTKLLLAKPARCINWKIVREFARDRGGTVKSVPGFIASYSNNGLYSWKLKFSNGRVVEIGCQDLVDVIIYSRAAGYPLQ